MPTIYHGDSYPSEVTCGQTERLDKYYKVAKEEYYSKSGKKPVTPENFHRWKTTRGAKGPVHLCELFSGSARLSYVALLAGLSVAFPVDLRYGWNLGTTSHQEIDPKVIVMSPSFGTWTSQATNLSSEDKERHAAEEVSASQFVKLQAKAAHRPVLLWSSGRGQFASPQGYGLPKQPLSTECDTTLPRTPTRSRPSSRR